MEIIILQLGFVNKASRGAKVVMGAHLESLALVIQ
jgi:hypothetical protein